MAVKYDPEIHGVLQQEATLDSAMSARQSITPSVKAYDPSVHGELPKETVDKPTLGTIQLNKRDTFDSPEEYGNVDYDFLKQVEGFETEGYVPQKNGQVLGASGVTIASGLDLGQWNKQQLIDMGIPEDIANKFEPFYGKRKGDALAALESNSLSLSDEEANLVNTKVKGHFVSEIDTILQEEAGYSLADIDPNLQTVITSVLFQYGTSRIEKRLPKFWKAVKEQDWEALDKELRNFGDKYKTRRKQEADLVTSYLTKPQPEQQVASTGDIDTTTLSQNLQPLEDGIFQDETGKVVRVAGGKPYDNETGEEIGAEPKPSFFANLKSQMQEIKRVMDEAGIKSPELDAIMSQFAVAGVGNKNK